MNKLIFVALVLLFACSPTDPAKEAWQGKWDAKWSTDPAGYGDLAKNMSFEMDGNFTFNGDEITISTFGYDGCIFGSDTLDHTQSWAIKGDTLELQNAPDEPGIQYKVKEQTPDQIKLQLVDDIFVTLTRQ